MKATYKLELEQQQRRLGLTHKQLNRYDRKHNDHNLIKFLQSLEPKVEASAAPATGFYGTLDITNDKTPGTLDIDIYARLYYNNNPLTNEITISYPNTGQLEVLIADRLPNPSSTLVLRIRFEAGITSVNLDAYDRFTPGNLTNNPLTENNYLDMVVDSGFIDGDTLSMTLITTTDD
jgi:hypothetical protein